MFTFFLLQIYRVFWGFSLRSSFTIIFKTTLSHIYKVTNF